MRREYLPAVPPPRDAWRRDPRLRHPPRRRAHPAVRRADAAAPGAAARGRHSGPCGTGVGRWRNGSRQSADAGVFRSTANPKVDDVLGELEQKVLTPRLGPAPPEKMAPTVTLGEGTVGSSSSLETRIDAAPPSDSGGQGRGDDVLKALLTKANIRAAMQAHRSEVAPDGVFVRLHSVVVLSASEDWNEPEVLKAIQQTIAPGITTSSLGAGWKKSAGAQDISEFDGLSRIAVSVRGKMLVVGTDAAIVQAVTARTSERSTSEPANYVAGFRHDTERERFYKMTSVLDRASRNNYTGQSNQQQVHVALRTFNGEGFSNAFTGPCYQSVGIHFFLLCCMR